MRARDVSRAATSSKIACASAAGQKAVRRHRLVVTSAPATAMQGIELGVAADRQRVRAGELALTAERASLTRTVMKVTR